VLDDEVIYLIERSDLVSGAITYGSGRIYFPENREGCTAEGCDPVEHRLADMAGAYPINQRDSIAATTLPATRLLWRHQFGGAATQSTSDLERDRKCCMSSPRSIFPMRERPTPAQYRPSNVTIRFHHFCQR
jgi:hypothetical protein